ETAPAGLGGQRQLHLQPSDGQPVRRGKWVREPIGERDGRDESRGRIWLLAAGRTAPAEPEWHLRDAVRRRQALDVLRSPTVEHAVRRLGRQRRGPLSDRIPDADFAEQQQLPAVRQYAAA